MPPPGPMNDDDRADQPRHAMTGTPPAPRHGTLQAVLILGFIAVGDWLFFGWPLGCNLAAYTALLLLALALCHETAFRTKPAMAIAVLLLGLVAAMLEYPGVLPLTLAAIGLVSLALTAREGWTGDAIAWMRRWGVFLWSGWLKWAEELAAAYNQHQKNLTLGGLQRLSRRWGVPSLLGAGFVALFAMANPIIERRLAELADVVWFGLQDILQYLEFKRVVFWMLIGIWGVALLRLKTGASRRAETPTPAPSPAIDLQIGPGLITRCLAVFNAVFAVQTLLDILYLWGGAQLPDGMTYAEYAHRGAYPLVATALLAAVFVLVTFRSGRPTAEMLTARRLVYVWLAQNVFLVISAGWRLNLYVGVYSLTRMRVAAAIWMFLVVTGLIWIGWRIVSGRSNRWLVNANLVTLLAVLYVCSFLNFDGGIASYNVRHCKEVTGRGVAIDLEYLERLGPESVPALQWLLENTDDIVVEMAARRRIQRLTHELAADLHDWRGWCYRRHRLARSVPLRPGNIEHVVVLTPAVPHGLRR